MGSTLRSVQKTTVVSRWHLFEYVIYDGRAEQKAVPGNLVQKMIHSHAVGHLRMGCSLGVGPGFPDRRERQLSSAPDLLFFYFAAPVIQNYGTGKQSREPKVFYNSGWRSDQIILDL